MHVCWSVCVCVCVCVYTQTQAQTVGLLKDQSVADAEVSRLRSLLNTASDQVEISKISWLLDWLYIWHIFSIHRADWSEIWRLCALFNTAIGQVEILESKLATQFTIQSDCRADLCCEFFSSCQRLVLENEVAQLRGLQLLIDKLSEQLGNKVRVFTNEVGVGCRVSGWEGTQMQIGKLDEQLGNQVCVSTNVIWEVCDGSCCVGAANQDE